MAADWWRSTQLRFGSENETGRTLGWMDWSSEPPPVTRASLLLSTLMSDVLETVAVVVVVIFGLHLAFVVFLIMPLAVSVTVAWVELGLVVWFKY